MKKTKQTKTVYMVDGTVKFEIHCPYCDEWLEATVNNKDKTLMLEACDTYPTMAKAKKGK